MKELMCRPKKDSNSLETVPYLPADLWRGVFYHLNRADLVTAASLNKGLSRVARHMLWQRYLVHACLAGQTTKIIVLLEQGAQAHMPDDHGCFPLRAVLLSLDLDAIKCLGAQIKKEGGAGWKRIELVKLAEDLNRHKHKPSALKKSYKARDGKNYSKYDDLKEWYAENRQFKELYDRLAGRPVFESDTKFTIESLRSGLCDCGAVTVVSHRVEQLITHMNVKINAVLDYAKQAIAKLEEEVIRP